MSIELMVTISEETYRHASQLAHEQNSAVEQLIRDAIEHQFAPFPINTRRDDMQREESHYRRLHAELVKQYLGLYVAIYQGQVVDHDQELAAIADRLRQTHPDETVFVRKVELQPERLIRARSPRLIRDV